MSTATDEIVDRKITSVRQLSRDQILSATVQCLREFGYDGTTIRKIASMLSCAVGSIYRYFRDKRDLLSAVTRLQMQPVLDLIDKAAPFEQTVRAYLKQAGDDPEMYRLMFWLAAPAPRENPTSGRLTPESLVTRNPAPGIKASQISPTATGNAASMRCELPRVVQLIVTHWGRVLRDEKRAKICWTIVHGSLLLGEPQERILATIHNMVDTPRAAAVPPSEQRLVTSDSASSIPPLTVITTPAAQDLANTAAEDVCLL